MVNGDFFDAQRMHDPCTTHMHRKTLRIESLTPAGAAARGFGQGDG